MSTAPEIVRVKKRKAKKTPNSRSSVTNASLSYTYRIADSHLYLHSPHRRSRIQHTHVSTSRIGRLSDFPISKLSYQYPRDRGCIWWAWGGLRNCFFGIWVRGAVRVLGWDLVLLLLCFEIFAGNFRGGWSAELQRFFLYLGLWF
jgi:hypothetical protein